MAELAFGLGRVNISLASAGPASPSLGQRSVATCCAASETRKIPALRRPVVVTGRLLDLCQEPLMPRNEVSKAVMRYVKANNLQVEGNTRRIACDATLRELFKTDAIDVIRLQQAVTPYLEEPGEERKAAVAALEKEIRANMPAPKAAKDGDREKRAPRKSKKKKTPEEVEAARATEKGIWKKVVLSKELSELCGGETMLARPDIVKMLWDYFKANNLQDPRDGRVIKCDAKMKKVFDNKAEITAFSLNKWISLHVKPR